MSVPRRKHSKAAPSLVWLLALAMLLAQALALMHGALHATRGGPPAGAMAFRATADAHPGGGVIDPAEADWVHRLFPDHRGGADCRLYDQAGHADTLPGVPMLVLPLQLSSHALHVFSGLALARWAALFQARAPPSVR